MQIHYLRLLHFFSLFVFTQVSAKPSSSCVAKPKFRMCSEYGLEVMENLPKGTFVGRVRAKVPYPLDEENPIEYLIAEQPGDDFPFSIDNSTGVISTKRIFDRDEPANDHKFYMTVLVKERGNPWLYDSCVVKITITDENDNAPVFHQKIFSEFLLQNMQVGDRVMKLSAHDIDENDNSTLTYSLLKEPLESWKISNSYFNIDESSGEIFLKRIIDKKSWFKFHLVAKVGDRGNPPKYDHADVEIQVVPSDFQLPKFHQKYIHIWVTETTINDSAIVSRLTVASNPTGKLSFEMLTGRTEQTNKEKTFTLLSSGNTTQIILCEKLDYERIKRYWLVVRATNEENMVAETTITIDIVDVNDNAPVFQSIGSLPMYIPEDEPPGYPVMKVQATDADGSTFNHITYHLRNNLDKFTIDNQTGIITTLTSFEKFKNDKFNIQVYASDNSPVKFYRTSRLELDSLNFSIYIAKMVPHSFGRLLNRCRITM